MGTRASSVTATQMYPPVRASIGRQGNGGGEVHVSRLRTVVRVLQHDGDFAAAFLGFRSSLQTFAGKAMLRTADAHKKVLDQLQTDAAERRRHAQGGGGRLVAATACNVKPPFALLRRALWYELKKFWSAAAGQDFVHW